MRTDTVRLADVYPSKENPRGFSSKERKEYVNSIAEAYRDGITVPPIMVVRDGGIYRIVDGECRYRAATAAGIVSQDVCVCDDMDEANAMLTNDSKEGATEVVVAEVIEDSAKQEPTKRGQGDSSMGLIKKKIKVRLTFIEEVLGTASSNPDIHEEFIASKAPDAPSREEEVAALGAEEVVEKSKTVFPRDDDGTPIFWDYQIRGFFKDTCKALKATPGTLSSGKDMKAYRQLIDGRIFVSPRKIRLDLHGGSIGNCQRPLRAQTAQGERIALANSDTVPAGTTCEFTIQLLDEAHEKYVMEWLDYGELKGMGQWRNSGKGKFTYEVIG